MHLDFAPWNGCFKLVDEVDDAVGALRLFAMGWSEEIGLSGRQQRRDLRGVRVRCCAASPERAPAGQNSIMMPRMASTNFRTIAFCSACIAPDRRLQRQIRAPPSAAAAVKVP